MEKAEIKQIADDRAYLVREWKRIMTREEIISEIANHIPFFCKHFESFCSHHEKCATVRKKAWDDAQQNPRLRDKEKGPPKPRWEWNQWEDNNYLLNKKEYIDIFWQVFWRPAKPVNLAKNMIIHAKFNIPIRDLTKRERFLCDCALLSVAHDYHSKLGPSDELIFQNRAYTGTYFERDNFCRTLWHDALRQPESDELIQRAFDRVKADLERKKPAETGQENKETKRKLEGEIEPKPPEILQKILWIRKHGRKHWKLVLLAILVLLIYCILTLLK